MLKAKNLRLKYPNGERKIFDNLNIEIKDKEKVLLLGPSGSGKSTLLNVLSGIVPNLIELPMKYDELEIDPHSGVIFQDPDTQFCMPKVYEELAFVLENKQVPHNEMDALIENALASVDLNVTDNTFVNHLSGGMKQKLAIVETILQEANTLFLDEPTAMLDVDATADLWQRLIQLWSDQTVLIVEHKVEHIWEHVDRVILLNYEGQIIADGTPDYILNNCEHLPLNLAFGILMLGIMRQSRLHFHLMKLKHYLLFENGQVIRGKTIIPDIRIKCSFWRMDYDNWEKWYR